MYDRLSELSLSIGRDQNGLAWRESMEGANCGLHPLIHTRLEFALALDVGVSQEECIGKRKPLNTLSRIEGLMKSPLTDTDNRNGWSQAYGELGLNSPFFIIRSI